MTINSSNTDDCTRETSNENELLSVNTTGNESLLIDDNENHNFSEEKIINEKSITKQNADKNNLNRSPLALVSLVGTCANKQPSNRNNFRSEKSPINDNSHLIEHSINEIPAQRPPRANKQRIAKLAGQKSRESPPNLINKPVDSNNNKVLKFNQQNIQQSNCRSSVPKTVLSRHQSCPNRIENQNSTNPTPTTRRLKEKITKLDMVPAQDHHSPTSILPDLDNCEVKNGLTGDKCLNEINENQINNGGGEKQLPTSKENYSQQLSDWKSILTHELNVYQNILKQRQQLHESSHSGKILNGDKPKKVHHNSTTRARSKTLKLAHNTPTTTTPELIDSLDDSWEKVVSTTDATPNSTPPTTGTTSAVTTSAESGRSASAGTTRATGASVRTKKYSSEKLPTRISSSGIQLANGKRRSASFKKNVKIITPYEKVIHLLETDKAWQKEIAFGRRIGLYRFRGDIGNGNFSQVKIAIHTLTKGMFVCFQ